MPLADDDLFAVLVARPTRGRPALIASVLAHVGVGALLILVPLFATNRPPEPATGTLRVFLSYDPPPPPPPPLARGHGFTRVAARPTPPTTTSPAPDVVAPREPTGSSPVAPDEPSRDVNGGDPSGSLSGDPAGMPGGVEGGVVGGIPGGVLGGVIGGTGTGAAPIPVKSPDRPARILRMNRPRYPRDAFVAKREGTVILEILIDEHGRVASARVIQSVPLLDDAAVACVYTWQFAPAIHEARPVASLAHAPISFRIF